MHVGTQSQWPFVLVVLFVAAYPLGADPTRQTGHVKQVSVRITDLVDPVHRGDDITYRIHSSGFSTDNNLVFSFGFRITVTGGAITAIHSYDFDCEFDGTYYCGITADGPDETVGGSLDVIVKAGDVSPVVLTVTTDIYAPYMYTESTTVLPCSDTVPLQVAPANNAAGVTTNGLLSWNPVDRGHYTVYLGPAGSGCTTVFAETDASLTQYLLDARTTYEWRVEASTVPGCPLTTTACQTFTTGNDCSIVPALLEPIGGTRAGPPVRFRWSEVPEATSYSLFLSTGDAPFVPLTTTTATSFTAPLLPLGKTRWYVTAAVDGCSAVRSDIASFEVLQGRKRRSASETRFPRHQKTDVHSVTIGIADSADPVHRGDEVTYDVDLWAFTTHVDELFHFAVRVELTNGILTHISNACHAVGKYWLCDFEVLEEGTEYFSVIATATAESPMALTVTNVDTYVPVTETTTVLPCSDAIPLPIVPANGAARVATRGELSWNPIDRGGYTVYLGPAGTGCTTVFGTTTASSFQYLLDASTAYEWRIEASTVAGCPLTGSACQSFTTGNDCAVIPALLEPIGGAKVSAPLTFRWSAVPEATSYSIFLSTGEAPFVPLGSTSGTSFSITLPANGKSRWYVTADVDGCTGVRSDIATFDILPARKRRSAR